MKEDVVKHSGLVQKIEKNFLQVKIVQTTSCSSCSIKNHCTSAESKEHLIDVYDKEASQYCVGDEVWIMGSTSMSRLAVWYGYLLPLIISTAGTGFVHKSFIKDYSYGIGDRSVKMVGQR